MDYNKQVRDFLKKTCSTLKIKFYRYGYHFDNDKDNEDMRDVYNVTLSHGSKEFTFAFGQSIVNKGKKPSAYDVLTCLNVYDIGTLKDFCNDFGYDLDSRKVEKTYKAVKREYKELKRLFDETELDLLREIQ